METSPISTVAASASASPNASSTVSQDFEMFLRLLTAQMQNQDPLDPQDPSDYAVQLATFSGVEQQVLTNDLLRILQGQMAVSGLSQMAGWVGREARAPVRGYFDGAPITLAPNPAAIADKVELVVRGADGDEVQRMEIPRSAEPLEWAGVDGDGNPMAEGLYSFEVISYSGEEVLLTERADIYARITEVRSEGGETILMFPGGEAATATSITALRDPEAS